MEAINVFLVQYIDCSKWTKVSIEINTNKIVQNITIVIENILAIYTNGKGDWDIDRYTGFVAVCCG